MAYTELEKLAICNCPSDILEATSNFKPLPRRIGLYLHVDKRYEFKCKFCGRLHWKVSK